MIFHDIFYTWKPKLMYPITVMDVVVSYKCNPLAPYQHWSRVHSNPWISIRIITSYFLWPCHWVVPMAGLTGPPFLAILCKAPVIDILVRMNYSNCLSWYLKVYNDCFTILNIWIIGNANCNACMLTGFLKGICYNCREDICMPWYFKSPATWLILQQLVHADNKGNTKALPYWSSWGEAMGESPKLSYKIHTTHT